MVCRRPLRARVTCTLHSARVATSPASGWQDAVVKEQPLQYNKPNLLNPCFVVFGRRTE